MSPFRFAASAMPLLAGMTLLLPSVAPAQSTQPPRPVSPAVAAQADSGTAARADPDMLRVIQKLQALGAKPIQSLSVEEARAQPSLADAAKAVLKDGGKDPAALAKSLGVSKTDLTYPTAGGPQPIRIYRHEGAGATPRPVIVFYHGGGWVLADLDTFEASAMALAKMANALVASVEYRHAPENKFPAAQEDAFAAYKWVLGHMQQFGADPARVAVAGESAGGNLAANVAIMARNQKIQVPVYMLLIYPVAGTDMGTPSYMENQNAVPLSKGAMGWFVDKTLARPEDAKSPMLNLATAQDLKGLPPATVITAEIDPLRSEGKMLAEGLKAAGVPTAYRNYDGVTHGFFGMGAVVGKAETAELLAAHDLHEAFLKASLR